MNPPQPPSGKSYDLIPVSTPPDLTVLPPTALDPEYSQIRETTSTVLCAGQSDPTINDVEISPRSPVVSLLFPPAELPPTPPDPPDRSNSPHPSTFALCLLLSDLYPSATYPLDYAREPSPARTIENFTPKKSRPSSPYPLISLYASAPAKNWDISVISGLATSRFTGISASSTARTVTTLTVAAETLDNPIRVSRDQSLLGLVIMGLNASLLSLKPIINPIIVGLVSSLGDRISSVSERSHSPSSFY